MDHAVLVDIDVQSGAEVVDIFDTEQIRPDVALFATFPEYYSPRLVLAADWLDQFDPLARYGHFGEVVRDKMPSHRIPLPHILKMSDPFIVDLRALFGHSKDVRGMRLGSQSFGGRFLEDGYVYRIQ